MLEIRLLGQFSLRRDGEPIALPSRAAQSLLAYLVINPGLSHRREQLAGLLCPDAEEGAARTGLRHALWRIRKSLGRDPPTGRDYLIADEIAVAFDATLPIWLDAAVLAARLPADASASELTESVAVYEGELLPGFYDDWIVLERERLEAAYEGKMRLLLERLSGAGHWDDALEWAERWIAHGHAPETAYCALMLAHAARGDASRVESAYRRCSGDLNAVLGVDPSEATQRLHQQLMRGEGVPLFSQAEVLGLPRRAAGPPLPTPPAPGASPYKGLRPFETSDAPIFFGREALTTRMIEHLRRQDALAVVGASGSGKSSLLRAGLVPALTHPERFIAGNRPLQNTADWDVRLMTPTGHPLTALATTVLAAGTPGDALRLADELASYPRCLLAYLARAPFSRDGQGRRLALIVDQFEELFTLCPSEAERTTFVESLMSAVRLEPGDAGSAMVLVIALRADFYGHCARYPRLRQMLETRQQYIGAMDESELRRCIEEPLVVAGWQVEPGLADLMIGDVGKEPGALPLLSHALLETWRRRSGRMLTLEGYQASGRAQGAIACTAETVFAQFDAQEQAVARRIFLRLTALGEVAQETRRRCALSELLCEADANPLIESVLNTLAEARLITVGDGEVEVSHEALIREWPRLRSWLAEDRDGLLLHKKLAAAAGAWEASGHDTAELYRGARLSQTREWASRHRDELNSAEMAFLEASEDEAGRAARERDAQRQRELEAAQLLAATARERVEEQRAANRKLRRWAVLLAGALAFALIMTALAMVMWRQSRALALAAQTQGTLALSRELAAAAVANSGSDQQLSLLLALQSAETAREAGLTPSEESEAALHRAAQAPGRRVTVRSEAGVAISRDGALAATAGADGVIFESSPAAQVSARLRFRPLIRR